MTPVDAELLSAAVVSWTGMGRTPWPGRDPRLVAQDFGAERAAVLMPLVKRLAEEFYAVDAGFLSADLNEMGDRASAKFSLLHPELSDEAVKALAWCYTWDYK